MLFPLACTRAPPAVSVIFPVVVMPERLFPATVTVSTVRASTSFIRISPLVL
jgi:hypothetical protein